MRAQAAALLLSRLRPHALTTLALLLIPGGFAAVGGGDTTALLSQAAQLRDAALRSNDAWNIVESLTTEVGPRPAGSAADSAAVAWA